MGTWQDLPSEERAMLDPLDGLQSLSKKDLIYCITVMKIMLRRVSAGLTKIMDEDTGQVFPNAHAALYDLIQQARALPESELARKRQEAVSRRRNSLLVAACLLVFAVFIAATSIISVMVAR
jgi:hypothetical protein